MTIEPEDLVPFVESKHRLFRPSETNAGPLMFNGRPVTRSDGSELRAGDIVAGNIYKIDTVTRRLID